MSDAPTQADLDRYVSLRSGWATADDAFKWLIEEIRSHSNGMPTDPYCTSMATRDLIVSTLHEAYGYSLDDAVDAVSGAGSMIASIQNDDTIGEHLLVSYQPDDAEFPETFIFALDTDSQKADTADHA